MIISEEEYFSHHGIKGMRWGIRNVHEKIGKSTDSSTVKSIIKNHSVSNLSKEQKKTLAENKKKHDSHFEPSEKELPKHGWRPTEKQVIIAGVGAATIAAIAYKVKTGKSLELPGFSEDDYLKAARSAETPNWLHELSGKKISPGDFVERVGNSTQRVWSGKTITDESFNQKEFILPKGHEFLRLSQKAEKTFNPITYTSASKEDFTRYLFSFAGSSSKSAQMISFKANSSIRVPDLHTKLETMRKVLISEGNHKLKPEDVINAYNQISGGDFNDKRSIKFLNSLRHQGFHAIVDEMDAGIFAEKPLVMIDNSVLSDKVSTSVAALNMDSYKSILTDIPNRR